MKMHVPMIQMQPLTQMEMGDSYAVLFFYYEDECPYYPLYWLDSYGDGFCDDEDECPENPNGWLDSNGDGVCDENDDTDGDGISDGEESMYGEDCAKSRYDLPDTDEDGILDGEDPFPRDPWPEFILYRNDNGTIDLMLSNRD